MNNTFWLWKPTTLIKMILKGLKEIKGDEFYYLIY